MDLRLLDGISSWCARQREVRRAAGLVSLLALMAQPAHGHNLSGGKWSSNPIVLHLQLGPAMNPLIDESPSWDASAAAAATAWNDVLPTIKFSMVAGSTAPKGDGNRVNNVVFAENVYGAAWNSRTLAITIVREEGGRNITEADVLFNAFVQWDSYRGAIREGPTRFPLYDFRRVAVHEFGHVLGLNHPDDIGQSVSAVMHSTRMDPEVPVLDDINGARTIYGGGLITAPAIVAHPAPVNVAVGSTATFTVVATGTPPLMYQWFRRTTPIAGATRDTFQIAGVVADDRDLYSVNVSNIGEMVSSRSALLEPIGPPRFLAQPASQTVTLGTLLSLSANVTGSDPLTYVWRHNGNEIEAYGLASFGVGAVTAAHAGDYTLTATNAAGSTTSNVARVTVVAPALPVIVGQPASQTRAVGQSVTFAIEATGNPLTPSNGPERLTYRWFKNGVQLERVFEPTYTIAPITATDAGSYTILVSNATGVVTSQTATLTIDPAAAGPTSWLSNLSVLTSLATSQSLSVGFTLQGGLKSMLVRAVGPGLTRLGVSGVMPDPQLSVSSGQRVIATNDYWAVDFAFARTAAATRVGAFPLSENSRDAGYLGLLEGSNTAMAWAATPGFPFELEPGTNVGKVLVEVYDAGISNAPRLINLSAMGRVGLGDFLGAGFTLIGTGSKRLLIRAVGPGLAGFGVTGLLADPRLELYNAERVRVDENDNWHDALAATFASAGAFALPVGSRDAALVVNLQPGGYTVQVSGANATLGMALIEVYELP
jgi:hypothetical protein